MSWVKLDDAFFDHPKIANLSDAAKVAYLEGICYCNRNLTDGFIPYKKAQDMAGKSRVIAELVPALWELTERGFTVHDYLDYQPAREQVLAQREAARQRMFGKRAQDVRPNIARSSPAPTPTPVPNIPYPDPKPKDQQQQPPLISVFEHGFGRLLSPMEIEGIHALEEEYPRVCIEHAVKESAELNKRTLRYVQSICRDHLAKGDCYGGKSDRTDRSKPAEASNTSRLAARIRSGT